jgi:putative FmdB family regulatory protein
MPIYEYRCKNGHNFEVMQRMADDPITVCEVCGEPVERVFHPVAIHFKGSGFYSTDYGRARGGGGSDSSSGSKDESKSKESSKESKKETTTTAKSSETSSSSDSGSSSSSD